MSVDKLWHSSYDWARAYADYLTISDTAFTHLHTTASTHGICRLDPPAQAQGHPTLEAGSFAPLGNTEPLGLRLLQGADSLGPQVLGQLCPCPHLIC